MSEAEFDLMDELYFVQPFSYLKESLDWEDSLILSTLKSLYTQGYIKCLDDPDSERFGAVDMESEGKDLFFLATKKGLMAHNTL
ncbi:hypothetical protein PBT90_14530 [Algoriphagus halophytocola]|uniref:Uncharacterized protein n=1 Tax=Algoriphagus halophytocola TaxID=2991499 RepID=A0ABY6MPY0_9BACT|nr:MULTISPECIES: hypothetical protein [unclassified Algoriphagus]UZD24596.1 hypothetical protein OM944_08865 [Algoriphagus sp. TR-M5]WBL41964.1 hypothetical protein PBT90_14530 [Algoriphagus sp. TR-M9]